MLVDAKVTEDQLQTFKQRRLRTFYKHQNQVIDSVLADLEQARDPGMQSAEETLADYPANAWSARLAVNGSFALNVLLLVAKVVAVIASGSMSALASAADSALDLVSGLVLFAVQRSMSRADPYKYPEGKSRLEPLGVVVFSVVMGMSSLQIIVEAAKRLVTIIVDGPTLDLGAATIAILASTIVLKLVALLVCRIIAQSTNSSSVATYAQDHFNDVLTNSVAVFCVLLAWWQPDVLGVLDPVGAILIALWIIASWLSTALEQIAKLAGLTAPPDFVRRLTHIVFAHDARVQKVDTCRAYHFGERFLVEVEIVMLPETPLRESHDVGITLQHKIERLEEVERAFVHIDYQIRNTDDHDPRTPVMRKTRGEVGTAARGGSSSEEEGTSLCHSVAQTSASDVI